MNETLPPTPQTNSSSSDDTLTFKRSHLYAALLPLAFVIGLSVGYLFWGRTPAAPPAVVTANEQNQAAVATPQRVTRYDVPVDDDPALGPTNAPITIIEFSDYECPYCRKWHDEVFGRLMSTYSDRVRFVYRDFPITSIHANALPAAEAANCAGEQGKYWEFHSKLFSMQLGLSTQAYQKYAADLGLDQASFDECLTSGRYTEEVQADMAFASNLGVRSTPTFFLNGIAIVGAQPFDVFQEVIQKELAGEIP